MKKVILKTALITLGVALVLAISVFGIVSLSAPYAMMQFTASLGLETISGDYAYQEYERSGDLDCLVRSFLVAAENDNFKSAEDRLRAIEKEEKFPAYCAERPDIVVADKNGQEVARIRFADYLYGRAACVKYALKEEDAVSFAVSKTDAAFPEGNPVAALTADAASAKDRETCDAILAALRGTHFEITAYYIQIVTILEGVQ